jgi:hypothetical protein
MGCQIFSSNLPKFRLVQVSSLLLKETLHQQDIERLTTESNAYKIAYSSKERDVRELKEKLEILKQESEKEKTDLENQLKVGTPICRRVTSNLESHHIAGFPSNMPN